MRLSLSAENIVYSFHAHAQVYKCFRERNISRLKALLERQKGSREIPEYP